jgi:hypothetical protein
MSSIRVWFITPGMDAEYDKVCRAFSPSTTVGEVVKQIHAEWTFDEKERDQPWVALRKHVLLVDAMTVRELSDMVPSGAKLKLLITHTESQYANPQDHRHTSGLSWARLHQTCKSAVAIARMA